MPFHAIEMPLRELYAQVRESLRERILDGAYPPHMQLPSEGEMGRTFGVSGATVRQALNDLQKEGLVVKITGKGTFVAKPKISQQLAQLEGFAEAMSRMGHAIRNKVISHKTVAAAPRVARRLLLEPGAPVCEIKRVRDLDGEPISLEVSYLPEEIGERLRREDLESRDIFLILEDDYRIRLDHADLQIEATLANDELMHALKVSKGAAMLRLERLAHTKDGVPLDFEYLYLRGDAFQYQLRVARLHKSSAHKLKSKNHGRYASKEKNPEGPWQWPL